ncbi:conserved unknown protein [Ectocarpus siliculosus]|uniref:Uncharacterized protein n=1 Tax=Ectocarpus siliculosus TaxID=2880 RepID=D7FS56_ECTSI|nr:conserved unknown protein [Ectocarpus siliculosus]|eukprot:CBJ30997.1 conserved unknown protein [Ectocarpus siliculosus]
MDPASSEAPSPPPADGGQCTAPASTVAFDVTQLCRTAASMLGPDEMIHDADFSLYGAMSALELMDTKMDKPPPVLESLDQRIASGALPTNLDGSVPPLPAPPQPPTSPAPPPNPHEEAASSSPSPATGFQTPGVPPHPSSFGPSQRTLSVLDGMSVCEVAWHEGGSLPETLYACLYLHPDVFSAVLRGLGWPLEQAPGSSSARTRLDLRIKEGNFPWKPVDRALTLAVLAQSLATLRCCSLARDVMILADIFEEEDFYPSTFGFRLAPPVEDESLTDLLALAEAAMRARIKCTEPLRQTGGAGGGDSRSPDECILAHLESRTQLLRACLALRDAFTNKQRLKRLKALEKRRAEELAQKTAGAGDAGTPTTEGAAETTAAAGGGGGASAASGGLAAGQQNGSGSATATSGPEDDVEVDSEVVEAATGLAAMSIGGRCPAKAVQLDDGGTAEGDGRVGSSTVASAIGGRDGEECGAEAGSAEVKGGQEFPAAENGCSNAVGLVVEGRAVGTTGGGPGGKTGTALAAPCSGEVIERKGEEGEKEEDEGEEEHQQRSECARDDIETPLNGIVRCGDHLRAAALALESLLAIEAFVPGGTSAETTHEAARNRPPVGGGVTAGAGAVTLSAAANRQGNGGNRKMPPLPPVRLGGDAGGFAFEAEMNRHLLGSSPQHHVHFRRGRAEGPRALLLLAREAERACGVIRCDDLLDVRRSLLRLYQPPAESKGGPAIGTASLFARSVAAVCLYRQDMVLGRFDVMWFVAEAMTDVGVPDAVVNSPSGMAFLDRVGKPVYETLRTLCLNRGRQRMSLELQMQDWRTLQAYASTVDDAFQLQYGLGAGTQRYMSKWALTEVLGLMHRYLQIGVELQLPSAHEWSGMFWYWDYVMTTKMMAEGSLKESKDQLEAVKAQMEEERVMAKELQQVAQAAEAAELAHAAASAAAAAATPALSGGGGKKSKKKKRGGSKAKKPDAAAEAASPGPEASPAGSGAEVGGVKGMEGSCARGEKEEAACASTGAQKTQREISWAIRRDWETADMKLRQFLCRGSVRLIAGLESLGMMGQKAGEWSEFRFTSPEIIHRERFRAFQALETPAFQPHRAFLEAVEFDEKEAVRVVDASAECFRAARTLASDLLRQGDLAAKEASVAGVAAALAGSGCCSGDGGGCGDQDAPKAVAVVDAVGAGWATDRLELLAMAKLAVSNGVAAMQVVKRASAGGEKGRARLEFDAHSQFPVAKATFD